MKTFLAGLGILLTISSDGKDLPAAWKNWRHSAAIDVAAADSPRLVSILLPAGVTAHSQPDGGDLRVIDAQGREVPHVLRARLGGSTVERRQARLLEPGFVPGQYTEALVDAGEKPRVHNSLGLDIDSESDFLAWVEVAISEDAKEWKILRERAPIYQLSKEGFGARANISYPDSLSRFLRVRVLDGTQQRRLRSATISYEQVTKPELLPVDAKLDPVSAPPAQQSVWESGANVANVPLSEVRFETTQETFFRPIRVEVKDEEGRWQRVASGEIYRTLEGETQRESLSVGFQESRGPGFRVTVFNHDDPPLPDLHPVWYGTPRYLVVRREPGQEYRLIFGNARATEPQYEMKKLTGAVQLDAAVPGTLRATETNSAYADPAPWTERHSWVMWLALLLALGVLGIIALRSLTSKAA